MFLLLTFPVMALGQPANQQLVIEPAAYQFAPRQINTVSSEKTFYIRNTGDSTATISPENIRLIADGPQSTGLAVLTYNLWYDSQLWPARLAHILEEIRSMNPDVIGLQEVIQRANLENQAKTLADSLGYHYYFASRDPESSQQRFGNAIISRHPIEEANWRALKPLSDYRTAVHARILVGGNTIDFYNTHIQNAAVNVHIREEQIVDLLDFIESTNSGGFIFVTGDFNANPDWQEMNLMYKDFIDVYPVFHQNHLDPEHGTLNHHLGHQQRRIDYIFFHKTAGKLLTPVSANVVLNTQSNAGIWGSDHFGVFATFQILSDADAFLLKNLQEETLLEPADSIGVDVAYAPFIIGEDKAILMVWEEKALIFGEGFDATIYDLPWTEDFTNTHIGMIPRGWETNSNNWQVSASELAGGHVPEMIFRAGPQKQSMHSLASPPVNTAGLDSLTLSFKHSLKHADDMSAFAIRVMCLANDTVSLVKEWINPGIISTEEISVAVNTRLHGTGQGMINLIWVFEGETTDSLTWHIDDLVLTAFPALRADPHGHDFGLQQINTASEPVSFILQNIGGGILPISPADISLTGEHAENFTLSNLTAEVQLADSLTAEIQLVFNPLSTGMMHAQIQVGQHIIPVSGVGFDPTISSLPWAEDFSNLTGGGIPPGWTSHTAHWGAFNANHAGGEAPEMVFWWQPETSGRFYLITPEIITTGMDTLSFSFKHRIRNFGDPGKYTLSVIAIVNDQEHLIHEWKDPDIQPATTFSAMIDASNHGIGQSPLQIAWVFDGTTDNITQWDIDDITLSELARLPIPEVNPESHDFGRQTIQTTSDPYHFVLKNRGGGILAINAGDIAITGPDAPAFKLTDIPDNISLPPFESVQLGVSFSPETTGEKQAALNVDDVSVTLTGLATAVVPYFIFSDFTITDNGLQYTNVEGFREVPAFARNGSLIVNDIYGEGEYGGVVLQLAYNLALATDYTIYYMWAYPYTNISGYEELVIYARASEPVTDIRLQMQDTSGVQGTDGAGYTYFDVSTEWQKIVIPVGGLERMPWAENLPDMSRIQKIDLVFEKNKTQPGEAILYVDLVGFDKTPVTARYLHPDHLFRMYPNPANQLILISAEPAYQVSLIDLTGRILHTVESTSTITEFDVSRLKQGLYLVRLDSEAGMEIKKLSVY